MSKWLYKGNKIENIEDFGDKTPFGFVYLIGNTITGKMYIGKKFLQRHLSNVNQGRLVNFIHQAAHECPRSVSM